MLGWLALGLFVGLQVLGAEVRGLPFSRLYSLEDIGYVPRGSRLTFDPFGRLAVVHDGVYSVLNDSTWLNLADQAEASRTAMTNVVQGPDGGLYYGGLGTWGRAEMRPDGKLHTRSLVPADAPAWSQVGAYFDVLATRQGLYFGSATGVVFWDPVKKHTRFFHLENPSKTFRAGDRVFVSRFGHGVHYLDVETGVARPVRSPSLAGWGANVVERATDFDDTRALLALLDGSLFVFDGEHATPWAGGARSEVQGRIAAIQRLADGNLALSVTERGVFVLRPDGSVVSALTIPQYHRVSDLASREPGVLWLINEDSIEKVLYGSGLTWFGQRLGLALEWPMVARWHGRTFVASAGTLYEAVSFSPGSAARFETVPLPFPNGVWALAAEGPHLLVGNAVSIHAMVPDSGFEPVASFSRLAHLVMAGEGLCYAIGPDEIALLRWDGQAWVEAAPRIGGVPNASVVHRAGRSAWIEMGGHGVARVSFEAGSIRLRVVPNETWTRSLWANVGVVDDVVVLTGGRDERRFFSERTGDWCEAPELDRLLNRSPAWLARVRRDGAGNLWATHNEGLVRFTPRAGDYEMDELSYDLINDRYPTIHILAGDEVWVSASRSLYHVEKSAAAVVRPMAAPVLVSLTDARRNVELLTSPAATRWPQRLPFEQNSLTFRFFAGSYAWRRTPGYEFRLHPAEPWTPLERESLLRFPGLREGVYQLEVRMAGQPGPVGPPLRLPFEILPPWPRTRFAYALYALAGVVATVGLIRWSGHLARRRNLALEQLVSERTGQLELTMQKLNDEARITATLAERNRLASEIHDSVQQGLSGAILQLDTTLTLPALNDSLRGRLTVVRNMVSYARQEVQHAVWDMDSPLLEGGDLAGALRKLATYISTGSLTPSVTVVGTPVDLLRSTTHHLLRIAQEATANALRHAQARAINIQLEYGPQSVVLTVSDDGRGFLAADVLNQAGHFGLRGIRIRSKKLHGTLTIDTAPGAGTTLRVEVPLPPRETL